MEQELRDLEEDVERLRSLRNERDLQVYPGEERGNQERSRQDWRIIDEWQPRRRRGREEGEDADSDRRGEKGRREEIWEEIRREAKTSERQEVERGIRKETLQRELEWQEIEIEEEVQ